MKMRVSEWVSEWVSERVSEREREREREKEKMEKRPLNPNKRYPPLLKIIIKYLTISKTIILSNLAKLKSVYKNNI